jgi:hypothetical protein
VRGVGRIGRTVTERKASVVNRIKPGPSSAADICNAVKPQLDRHRRAEASETSR